MWTARPRRAFTLVDLVTVLVLLTIGAALTAAAAQPAAGGPEDAEKASLKRQEKDASQIRGIFQAMVIFGNNNKDVFPLPSVFDVNQSTVTARGRTKDTTANIFSILIYGGSISTEACVSPAESNPSIAANETYEYDRPKAAAKPAEALWDPAFNADFTGKKKGNISYAHLQPAGGRLAKWTSTFMTTEPVVGNRGPEIASVSADKDGVRTVKPAKETSNTYLIHGPRDSWEGNIAFADGHVAFLTELAPKAPPKDSWPMYTAKDGTKAVDVMFFDEPDDETSSNAFLGIFIRAGQTPADYKAIWD